MDPERMPQAEHARRLARCGWSNAEIAAITGLRPRSVRDALREDVRAGVIAPNEARRGAGAISAPGARC